jgi:hypothetical protein
VASLSYTTAIKRKGDKEKDKDKDKETMGIR